MKPHNSFSGSNSFSESDFPQAKIVLFKPDARSQIVSAARLRSRKPSRLTQLANLWNVLLNLLCSRPEPQIVRKRDRFGHSYFQVHDPVTDRTLILDSEQELRTWIDQRYYQS